MFKRLLTITALLIGTSTLTGCATNHASGQLTPGSDLSQVKTAYVVKQPKDKQQIDGLIKANLEKRGYVVTLGPELSTPYNADVAITYVDKWMWDITLYLLELTINVRDPKSGYPLANGNALHTSLTRKTPEYMVNEVIDHILAAPKK